MLASITPLGERSRGSSWTVTATAFVIGAVVAGGLAGAALGALGSLLPGGEHSRAVALAPVLAAAVLFDATPLRRKLPSSRRQVNEDWLGRYRGWVYGVGFGAQLGVTIVTTAMVYAALACALLCPSVAAGALVGVCFGTVRGLSLLPARRARNHEALVALHRRVREFEKPSRTIATWLELVLLVAVLGALLW
jgi:MFS family permease